MRHPRLLTPVAVVMSAAAILGGCGRRAAVAPSASPPTAVAIGSGPEERVLSYPEGRYERYGDGTARSPFFWVWIPTGATPPAPPPLPPR
jgi:hypothetical protein